jgi:hypothetical protein
VLQLTAIPSTSPSPCRCLSSLFACFSMRHVV